MPQWGLGFYRVLSSTYIKLSPLVFASVPPVVNEFVVFPGTALILWEWWIGVMLGFGFVFRGMVGR